MIEQTMTADQLKFLVAGMYKDKGSEILKTCIAGYKLPGTDETCLVSCDGKRVHLVPLRNPEIEHGKVYKVITTKKEKRGLSSVYLEASDFDYPPVAKYFNGTEHLPEDRHMMKIHTPNKEFSRSAFVVKIYNWSGRVIRMKYILDLVPGLYDVYSVPGQHNALFFGSLDAYAMLLPMNTANMKDFKPAGKE